MEPKTIDEAAAEAGSTDRETGTDEAVQKGDTSATETDGATATPPRGGVPPQPAQDPAQPGGESGPDLTKDGGPFEPDKPSAAGQGAGAVISAGLAVVSLTGSWLGTVAGARESVIGQISTSQSAGPAKQIQELYGDQWHAIALVGGIFALVALVIGVVVLARPAFGEPGDPQPVWIKSVAWGGVFLGVLGLLLAILKVTDVLLPTPSVG